MELVELLTEDRLEESLLFELLLLCEDRLAFICGGSGLRRLLNTPAVAGIVREEKKLLLGT